MNGNATVRGKLFGVSVGPGDPGMMTLRAVGIIEKCRVIAAPRTNGTNMSALGIAEQAVDLSGKKILPLDVPMTRDTDALERYRRGSAELIAGYLAQGEDTAMLSLGDISVYSTFRYIAEAVRKMGFETEMCAGVTSSCEAAARLGMPLVSGNEPLIIIPAECRDIDELLCVKGTKVIMKCGRKMNDILGRLRENENVTEVSAAENAGTAGERLFRGIDDIGGCGYFTTLIVK